ncbi:MAG TPA: endonuclease/exonuclease/phosphatase family protein, partial [Phycisphaerales bacterium]|nr:endonuclease/exonuclease/phosphatase family protein [Phycisphaerales bacterium]
MKARHMVIIAAGVAILGVVLASLFLRGGEKPWASKAPSKSGSQIRIATFNVDGLYDPDDDPALAGEYDDTPSDQPHLEAIASAIRAVDADILALENVESLEAVRWFNQTFLQSMGYEHIASLDVGHKRGLENAVLSRLPIT